jgi:hypothetical protein
LPSYDEVEPSEDDEQQPPMPRSLIIVVGELLLLEADVAIAGGDGCCFSITNELSLLNLALRFSNTNFDWVLFASLDFMVTLKLLPIIAGSSLSDASFTCYYKDTNI